jgi:ABC-type Fe3+ transport system permease subunit
MFADNPQSFINGYLSGMRNAIITVSLGVAIYGFSRSFKKKSSRSLMKKLSILVYFFSFFILVNSNLILRKYLNSLTHQEKSKMPKYVNLNSWKNYEYLGWGFSFITFIVIYMGLIGYIRKIF